jgi:hypothetical protein
MIFGLSGCEVQVLEQQTASWCTMILCSDPACTAMQRAILRRSACAAHAALRQQPSCSAEAPRPLLQRRSRPAAWSVQHCCALSSSATEPVVVHKTTSAAGASLAQELGALPKEPAGKPEKLAPFNPVAFKALPHFDREKSIAQTQNTVRELYSEGSYKEALEAAEVRTQSKICYAQVHCVL